MTARPVPALPDDLAILHVDATSAPFWEAAREHRLVVQRCSDCGQFRMPPAARCWSCRSAAAEWVQLTGDGTILTYTVTRHALIPALAAAVPYAVAVIDLDGAPGARLAALVVDSELPDVQIGARVRLVYDDVPSRASVARAVLVDQSVASRA
jgi:uncharacterized OB-fold protein